MDQKLYFENEWNRLPNFGIALNFQLSLAIDIARQSAIVAGADDGEDSSGRRALRLLKPAEVAERAMDIAANLVSGAEARGWIRPTTISDEQRAQYAGLLEKLKLHAGYNQKDDNKLNELMALISNFTKQPA